MNDRYKIEAPVRKELEAFNTEFASALNSDTRRLQTAIDTILSSTGKHVRPILLLLSAKACGKVTDNSVSSAVLIELLHTATLIHDDVVDETKERRGKPSLNAVYDNKVSVLVGDYLLSSALIRAFNTGSMEIVAIVSNLGKDLSEGEIKQMETAEESILDEDCYLQVIYKKTAVLLAACAKIGAISANAEKTQVEALDRYGKLIGYAFQIKDDIFDYYKNNDIGKPTGNDIREGKITLPLLHALKTTIGEERDRLLDIILKKNFTSENIEKLIRFAKDNGGIEYAEKRMNDFHQQAIEQLSILPESEAKEALKNLADYIIERNK
jgi:octaprenyl-diphosphate synthase